MRTEDEPPSTGPAPGTALPLAPRLAVAARGIGRFRSVEVPEGPHVFGGLLVGQALRAAALTVAAGHPARSLHASFLVAGRGGVALDHEVETTRDGASFATRRVTVRQGDVAVLVLTADFHRPESGVEYAPPPAHDVPGPDGLPPGRYHNAWIESRDVPVTAAPAGPAGPAHARRAWLRVRQPLPDDPALYQHAIAYLSDHGPTRAAREPHAHLADDARRQSVSLDHSVWFHRPADPGEWLLSELVPVSTAAGRGLAVGSLRTATGLLVATVAQEVLLRER